MSCFSLFSCLLVVMLLCPVSILWYVGEYVPAIVIEIEWIYELCGKLIIVRQW